VFLFAAGGGVLLAALAGAVWAFGGSPEDTPEEVAASIDEADGYYEASELSEDELTALGAGEEPEASPGGREQILSVVGAQGFVESLVDLGIPSGEAMALSRNVIAGLGTDEGDWLIEMRVLDEADGADTDAGEPRVEFLSAWLSDGNGVELTRQADASFQRRDVFSEVTKTFKRASGEMGDHDFYTVAVNAGIPDSLISEFARVFSYDFSFSDDVKAGDTFEAIWEAQVNERGDSVAPPQLMYARMATDKGDHEYFAFVPPGDLEAKWYDPEGQTNVRSLMRTPVDGARISSRFGFRNHPIRRRRILHGGVDFAAPTGTPVYASGDAIVQFRGRAGGAGNLVKLDHGDGMITRYLHLHNFADGLAIGQRVRQGETIGYVGSTGASTGPHLHYEIIINGEKLDPLTFSTTKVEPLLEEAMTMFRQQRTRLESELN